MAFSEKLKLEVKEKSDFKCIICENPIVQVHHIIPQEENGPDTFENAVALCAHCHNIYGGNKLKRDEIKSIRDRKYKDFKDKFKNEETICIQKAEGIGKAPLEKDNVLLFINISEKENFEQVARKIFNLIYKTSKRQPNVKRTLIIEIDGHRVKAGGYDNDMFELQSEFAFKVILPMVNVLHMPLISVRNPEEQKNPEAEQLLIFDSEEEMNKKEKELKGAKIIKF